MAAASAGYPTVAATELATTTATNSHVGAPVAIARTNPAASPQRTAAEPASTALRDQRSATTPAAPEQTAYGANPKATDNDVPGADPLLSSTARPRANVSTSWPVVASA